MTVTMFLLGLVYVGFISVAIALGANVAFVIVIAAAIGVAQLFFSDKLALAVMRARVTQPNEAPELHAIIERLCQLADLPKPKVAVADLDIPNAFAAGRSQKAAVVCVTTGLMNRLEPRELEGVLAHELTHIANRDVMVMTVASFLATVAALVIRMGLWGGMMGGGRRDDNNNAAAVFMLVVLVAVVTYVISFFLLRALSRYREYAADRGAAIITGAPAQLAAALTKITGAMSRIPNRDLRAVEGMNAFFIAPAVARGFSLSSIFATHPPVEKRVARLLAMQTQMEGAPRAAV
jgi:heat shock protein HtpX